MFPQHGQDSSQGRGIGAGSNAKAVARGQDQFQRRMPVGSGWVGVDQCEANRLSFAVRRQALPPVIKGLIAEAVLPTKSAHRQLALLLFADQPLPLLL